MEHLPHLQLLHNVHSHILKWVTGRASKGISRLGLPSTGLFPRTTRLCRLGRVSTRGLEAGEELLDLGSGVAACSLSLLPPTTTTTTTPTTPTLTPLLLLPFTRRLCGVGKPTRLLGEVYVKKKWGGIEVHNASHTQHTMRYTECTSMTRHTGTHIIQIQRNSRTKE